MSCGKHHGEIVFVETPNLQHHGKEICEDCGKWFKWVSKPENVGTRKRISKISFERVASFHKMEQLICFLCLRNKDQLVENETLTRDHIVEINTGGKDIVENLQILCSACHKLKNWLRLYTHWHHK